MSNPIHDDPAIQDLNWQIEYSNTQARAAGKVALISVSVLLLLVGLLIPFLAGFPLHSRWDSIGKYLLLLIAVPFLMGTYLVGQFAIRLQVRNEFRRDLTDLLEDRYGITREQQKKLKFGA